jgi:5-methyltetrahydropteroyltriglutamate--homocysteine methyltransferase
LDVRGFITGIYPRSEALIRAFRAHERGELGEDGLREAILTDKRTVIGLQQAAGLTEISDPLLDWDDLLRPFSEALGGVRPGSLTRLFETNSFYRQPVVEDRLVRDSPILRQRVTWDLLPEDGVRLILPAPRLFAHQAQLGGPYRSREDLMLDFAELLVEEVVSVKGQRLASVQLSDPSLVYDPPSRDEWPAIAESLRRFQAIGVEVHLHTYFADAAPIFEQLLELPVDWIGIDLAETDPGELPADKVDKGLVLGALDGGNSRMEEPSHLAAQVLSVARRLGVERVTVAPNCDLDFLPRELADQKLRVLGEALSRLKEGGL